MSRARWLLIAGAAVAIASAFAPMSSDEGAWLAIERRVASGGTLYVDAIDNKSPFVFGLVRALDLMPGSYELWRGLLLGVLVLTSGLMAGRALERLGCEQRTATAGGLLVAVSMPLASVLTLTIELPAAVLALAGIAILSRRGHPASAVLLAAGAVPAAAVLFDPRAVMLVAGVVLLALRWHGTRGALLVALGSAAIAGTWGAVVLADASLRFALVDLNIASRRAAVTDPLEQLAAALRAMIAPVVGVLAIARAGEQAEGRRVTALDALVVGIPVGVVIILSRHGFDHYWTLAVPVVVLALPAAIRSSSPLPPRVAAAFVVLAIVAPAVHAVRLHLEQADTIALYRATAVRLDARLGPGETFTQFTGDPYLAALRPDRFGGAAPLLGPFVSEHPRLGALLEQAARDIASSRVVVDDGGLGAPRGQVKPGYRPLYDLFVRALDRFGCRERIGSLVIHLRDCPA